MRELLKKVKWGRVMGFGSWLGAIGVILFFSIIITIFLVKNEWSLSAMRSIPWATFGLVAGAFFTLSQVVISIMIGRSDRSSVPMNPNFNRSFNESKQFPLSDKTSTFQGGK